MEEKQLKKFLAGLCITGLLSSASLTVAAEKPGQSS
jgi:radical SAM modification target selenobiotic family peptide